MKRKVSYQRDDSDRATQPSWMILRAKLSKLAEKGDVEGIARILALPSGPRAAREDAHDAGGDELPLVAASRAGHLACVQMLFPHWDVKRAKRIGAPNPLIAAAQTGRLDCVQLLAERIDAKDARDHGVTALMAVLLSRRSGGAEQECLDFLLPRSNPMAQDEDGETALHWAIYHGREESIEKLAPVSDLTQKSKAGKTAFELAISERWWRAADAMAPFAPWEALEKALADSTPQSMPRAEEISRVRAEARALREAVDLAKGDGVVGDSAARSQDKLAGEPQNRKRAPKSL